MQPGLDFIQCATDNQCTTDGFAQIAGGCIENHCRSKFDCYMECVGIMASLEADCYTGVVNTCNSNTGTTSDTSDGYSLAVATLAIAGAVFASLY